MRGLIKAIKITLFILVLPTLVLCQNSKLTIDIAGSPCFYNIKSAKGFNHDYKPKQSYNIGVDLLYRFNKRSLISLGFYYSSLSYNVVYNYIYSVQGDPSIPSSGNISAKYLDIPLIYSPWAYGFYISPKQKLELNISTGIVSSMLLSSNDNTTFEDNSIRNSGYLNSFVLSVQLGVGLKYIYNDKIGIVIEPQYKWFLKGIDKLMNQYPTAINGKVGIIFKL